MITIEKINRRTGVVTILRSKWVRLLVGLIATLIWVAIAWYTIPDLPDWYQPLEFNPAAPSGICMALEEESEKLLFDTAQLIGPDGPYSDFPLNSPKVTQNDYLRLKGFGPLDIMNFRLQSAFVEQTIREILRGDCHDWLDKRTPDLLEPLYRNFED